MTTQPNDAIADDTVAATATAAATAASERGFRNTDAGADGAVAHGVTTGHRSRGADDGNGGARKQTGNDNGHDDDDDDDDDDCVDGVGGVGGGDDGDEMRQDGDEGAGASDEDSVIASEILQQFSMSLAQVS